MLPSQFCRGILLWSLLLDSESADHVYYQACLRRSDRTVLWDNKNRVIPCSLCLVASIDSSLASQRANQFPDGGRGSSLYESSEGLDLHQHWNTGALMAERRAHSITLVLWGNILEMQFRIVHGVLFWMERFWLVVFSSDVHAWIPHNPPYIHTYIHACIHTYIHPLA